MLVVCNGAIKSGSTWLYNILTSLVALTKPPDDYLTARGKVNATIRPEKLREFLEREDYHSRDYITKNHLGRPEHRQLLLSFKDVVVLDIARDVRDVVVSAYYDARNREGLTAPFEEYYWRSGRELADALTRYHELWKTDGERVLQVSYERLQTDFANELRSIAGLLGVELSPQRADEIKTATSMSSLKERYKEDEFYRDDRFFRKGIVGDWHNHFTSRMALDIERIERRGLSPLDWRRLMYRAQTLLSTAGFSRRRRA